MTKRTARALAAAALASSFLLTACGGDDEPKEDKIQGADSEDKPPASASPSEEAEEGAPTFDLPSDVKVNFEGFEDSDPVKNEVLRDLQYATKARVEQGTNDSSTQMPNMKRYHTGLEGAELTDTIIKYTQSGKRYTGKFVFYLPEVELSSKTKAHVTYCEDQNKVYDKDAETGKVNVNAPSSEFYRQWEMFMAKNDQGDWQMVRYEADAGAEECQR